MPVRSDSAAVAGAEGRREIVGSPAEWFAGCQPRIIVVSICRNSLIVLFSGVVGVVRGVPCEALGRSRRPGGLPFGHRW